MVSPVASIDRQSVSFLKWPETQTLMAYFRDGDIPFRFVGGAVRDILLGRPVNEVDIATPKTPEQILAFADHYGIKHKEPGFSHGTVILLVDHRPFEITTLRYDVKTDGRHATVSYTDNWYEDSARRDFTCNAIYLEEDGTLFDPQDGVADALAGRIRFVGNPATRLAEDRLRALRFLRFQAQIGKGAMEPEGLAAIQDVAHDLSTLSGERIRYELERLITAANSYDVLATACRLGLLNHLLPGLFPGQLANTPGMAGRTRTASCRFSSALVMSGRHPTPSTGTGTSALFPSRTKAVPSVTGIVR